MKLELVKGIQKLFKNIAKNTIGKSCPPGMHERRIPGGQWRKKENRRSIRGRRLFRLLFFSQNPLTNLSSYGIVIWRMEELRSFFYA